MISLCLRLWVSVCLTFLRFSVSGLCVYESLSSVFVFWPQSFTAMDLMWDFEQARSREMCYLVLVGIQLLCAQGVVLGGKNHPGALGAF